MSLKGYGSKFLEYITDRLYIVDLYIIGFQKYFWAVHLSFVKSIMTSSFFILGSPVLALYQSPSRHLLFPITLMAGVVISEIQVEFTPCGLLLFDLLLLGLPQSICLTILMPFTIVWLPLNWWSRGLLLLWFHRLDVIRVGTEGEVWKLAFGDAWPRLFLYRMHVALRLQTVKLSFISICALRVILVHDLGC